MEDSIVVNAPACRKYIYRPPAPPSELIDATVYILDFTARKFIHIGLDHNDNFNLVIQIVTPSRYVCISPSLLRRIFSLMGNILSFILSTPQKTKKTVFLDTEFTTLSSMVYRGENMLVIESKTREGCRVLLARSDLINLQYLEWCILETITRKTKITRPSVLKQLEEMVKYFEKEFVRIKPLNINELTNIVQNIREEDIINNVSKNHVNYISQLKLYAYTAVAELWLCKWNLNESKSIDELKPPSTPPPPTYSYEPSASQQGRISTPKMYDNFEGGMFSAQPISPPLSISSEEMLDTAFTEMVWVKKRKQETNKAYCDENDGPLRFNRSSSFK